MKQILLFLGMLVAFNLVGCGSSTESTPSGDVLIPLTVGNRWAYETTYYDSSGVALSPTYIDTSFVGLSTNLIGKLWYFYNRGGTTQDILLFRNDNMGVSEFNENLNAEFVKFPYPSVVGTFMVFSDTFFHLQVTVFSTNEEVTTPKGVFNCYHYRPESFFRDNNFNAPIEDFYIAPNVGVVKEIESNIVFTTEQSPDPIFGVTKVRVLKDYLLK